MYKKIMYFLILSMISSSYAQSINEQIEAVKNAQPNDRVAIMNRLKVQIAEMNEHERMQAINALQKSKGVNQANIQFRMPQVNTGMNSMQQVNTHTNPPPVSRGQGR